MPNLFQIAAIVGTTVAVHELIRVRPLRKKFNIVAIGFTAVCAENKLVKEKARYMFNVLEENDILSDFDLIVLNHDLPTQD